MLLLNIDLYTKQHIRQQLTGKKNDKNYILKLNSNARDASKLHAPSNRTVWQQYSLIDVWLARNDYSADKQSRMKEQKVQSTMIYSEPIAQYVNQS